MAFESKTGKKFKYQLSDKNKTEKISVYKRDLNMDYFEFMDIFDFLDN